MTASRYAPGRARWRIDVRVQLVRTGDLHVRRVPVDYLAREALRDAAQQERLRDRALNFEVGQRSRPALAGCNPLIDRFVGARLPRLARRRSLILRRFGIDPRV